MCLNISKILLPLFLYVIPVDWSEASDICQEGWNYFERSCYNYHCGSLDWESARKSCAKDKAHLVEVTSAAENAFLVRLGDKMQAEDAWIGLKRDSYGRIFSFGQSGHVANFTNWANGQPYSKIFSLAFCVEMVTSGKWNDLACSKERPYFCERPPIGIESNVCSPSPCLNGGRCFDGDGYYTCYCTGHFAGRHCGEETCLPGWTLFEGSCYFVGIIAETWSSAQSVCRSYGGNFPEIFSAAENSFLVHLRDKFSGEPWIGLKRDGMIYIPDSLRWVSSGYVTTFTNWASGQPNRDITYESCVTMSSLGKWDDVDCEHKHTYFCKKPVDEACPPEWTLFEGSCYFVGIIIETWSSAQSMCRSYGGNLPEVTSTVENSFLVHLKDKFSGGDPWIGLRREGKTDTSGLFRWVPSGFRTTFTNWASGQPNRDITYESCVAMSSLGKWDDVDCEYKHSYFCKRSVIASSCIYKSKMYNQGDVWQDGCQYNCTCEDAKTGFYRCQDFTCHVWNNLPSDCTVEKKLGECCSQHNCGGTILGPDGSVTHNYCVYGHQVYKDGEQWRVGCKYKCTCVYGKTGLFQCQTLCKQWTFPWILPKSCHLDPPPPGKCCQIPVCPSNVKLYYPPGFVQE